MKRIRRELLFFLVELGAALSKWAARQLGDDILQDAYTDDELAALCVQETEGWDATECELYNRPEIIESFRRDLTKQWGRD